MTSIYEKKIREFAPRLYYGWIVVAACFICCMTYGTFYTFGIFFKPLQDQFGWSYTLTSSVQSIHILIYIISSFVVGWATDRFGPRWPLILCALCVGVGYLLCSRIQSIGQLYLFYSIASMGAGLVWSLPLSIVQRWFIERRGLAVGITVSGIGIGTFVWAPTVNYLVYQYGWRIAYVVMGLVTGTALSLSAVLVGTPEKKDIQPYGDQKMFSSSNHCFLSHQNTLRGMGLKQAIMTKELWLICLFQLFFNVGIFLVFVHLVPFAIQTGIDRGAAAAALGLMGGLSVLGRIITPVIIEKRMASQWERGLIVCGVCATIMLLWLTQVDALWMLYLFVIILGYFYGSWIPLVVALTGSCFGLKHLGTLLGVTQIGLVGAIIGPLLGGIFNDKTGDYSFAFVVCSISFFLAAIVAFVIKATGSNRR